MPMKVQEVPPVQEVTAKLEATNVKSATKEHESGDEKKQDSGKKQPATRRLKRNTSDSDVDEEPEVRRPTTNKKRAML